MKQLSNKSRRLIEQLARENRPTALARLFGANSESRAALIRDLAQLNEVAAIPYLRDYLIDKETIVRDAAATAVRELMSNLSARDHVWLDNHMRDSWLMSHCWHSELTPRCVDIIAGYRDVRAVLLGLAATHGSGYVRERAVMALDRCVNDGQELPFLLLRCNDWVEQVRSAAVRATARRLNSSYLTHFVNCLPLVQRLRTCERADHAALLQEIRRSLLAGPAGTALLTGLAGSDLGVRRACFELLEEAGDMPFSELLSHAAKSADSIVRLHAVSAATRRLAAAELSDVLRRFSSDSSSQVRRAALIHLADLFPDESGATLEPALFDQNASVRDIARYYLRRQQPARCFQSDYQSAIGRETGRRLTAAIAGLGETGNESDAETVLGFLDDKLPRNRRTALRALSRLAPAELMHRVPNAIADESPGVSREATVLTRRASLQLASSTLAHLAETTAHDHVARNALTLLAQQHSWDAVIPILQACLSRTPSVSEHAVKMLRTWARRPYIPAGDPSELERLEFLLNETAAVVPEGFIGYLRFMAGATKR